MSAQQPVSLLHLTNYLTQVIGAARLNNIWIVAETADVRFKGGHCYLDLIEKDLATGHQLAKVRATIWQSTANTILRKFQEQTGMPFRSDLNVMVCASVVYSGLYGLTLNICDINGSYTLGDVQQRRDRILKRLQQEGILEMNRSLPWPLMPQRIAVISSPDAAGYGDFLKQLYTTPERLRFTTRLFPAIMQGERTAPTVIAALEAIAADPDGWDCVAIIRGGGASSDLLAFDNYDLAANIAQFPLPVIIGIGHERDITVLDYVARIREKTPTAVAQLLVTCGKNLLDRLQSTAKAMLQSVTDRLRGCSEQIASLQSLLPAATQSALMKARTRLDNSRFALASVADRRLAPGLERLNSCRRQLEQGLAHAIDRERRRLDSLSSLVSALSPEATLRRGYSITRIGGRTLRSAAEAKTGDTLETVLADGTVRSTTL